jgi:L-lysine 2,3-aminomutase
MSQSNSIVERANGVIKRIINKLIFKHMNEDYSKWSQFLDEAVKIYNNTKNVSTGMIPNNSVLFQEKKDINDVKESIKGKAIKPAPYQNSFKTYQHVRLRIPKNKLDKFDRENWSNQEFMITRVIFPTKKEMEGEAAKPVRYRIHPINSN